MSEYFTRDAARAMDMILAVSLMAVATVGHRLRVRPGAVFLSERAASRQCGASAATKAPGVVVTCRHQGFLVGTGMSAHRLWRIPSPVPVALGDADSPR